MPFTATKTVWTRHAICFDISCPPLCTLGHCISTYCLSNEWVPYPWFLRYINIKPMANTFHWHELQHTSWDCGAACARAVLAWSDPDHAFLTTDLDASTRACWSIEILVVLRHFNVDCKMYTTNSSGVSPSHGKLSWYDDGSLLDDEGRVAELFRSAKRDGSTVIEVYYPNALGCNTFNLACKFPP